MRTPFWLMKSRGGPHWLMNSRGGPLLGAVCWWILEADPLLRGCILMNSRCRLDPLLKASMLINSRGGHPILRGGLLLGTISMNLAVHHPHATALFCFAKFRYDHGLTSRCGPAITTFQSQLSLTSNERRLPGLQPLSLFFQKSFYFPECIRPW